MKLFIDGVPHEVELHLDTITGEFKLVSESVSTQVIGIELAGNSLGLASALKIHSKNLPRNSNKAKKPVPING